METTYVAAFPGMFLHVLDCPTTLKQWQENEKNRYTIEICKPENWKEQCFLFNFSKSFVKRAYKGFGAKGKRELERAKSIEQIFVQRYEAKLQSNGLLEIKVIIPDEWNMERRKLAKTEVEFQFYHVAKSLFETVQKMENMEYVEFKKFFTYLGEDGIEGFSRKLALGLKKHFEEDFLDDRLRLETFKEQLGKTSVFPFRVLGKSRAFRVLMSHYSRFSKLSRNYVEREFGFLFERLYSKEKSMISPLNTVKEGLTIYETTVRGLENIKEMFSFQLGVSSTFFEVIGLTITVSTLLLAIAPSIFSGFLILFLIGLYAYEIKSLLKYSIGPMIEEELNYLISELRKS